MASARVVQRARRLKEDLLSRDTQAQGVLDAQPDPSAGPIFGWGDHVFGQKLADSSSRSNVSSGDSIEKSMYALAAGPVQGSLGLAKFVNIFFGYFTSQFGWANPGARFVRPNVRVQQARNTLADHLLDSMETGLTDVSHTIFLREFASAGRFALEQSGGDFFTTTMDTELEALAADFFWSLHSFFIGIGTLEDNVFGAGRVQSSDQDWQAHVEQLVEYADFIVLLPGATPGVLWELELLQRKSVWDRVLFVMPWASGEFMNAQRWEAAREACLRTGLSIPEFDQRGALFTHGEGGWVMQENLEALCSSVCDFELAMLDLIAFILKSGSGPG